MSGFHGTVGLQNQITLVLCSTLDLSYWHDLCFKLQNRMEKLEIFSNNWKMTSLNLKLFFRAFWCELDYQLKCPFCTSFQTLNNISAEKNSTIIFPLPIDLITHFMKNKKKNVWPASTRPEAAIKAAAAEAVPAAAAGSPPPH